MLTFKQPRLFILGGASGIVGTSCYVMAIALPLNIKLAFLLAMIWPILSIIFVFSLFQFINLHKKLVPNYLAFIFACLAFTLLAVMVSSQLWCNCRLSGIYQNFTRHRTGNPENIAAFYTVSGYGN